MINYRAINGKLYHDDGVQQTPIPDLDPIMPYGLPGSVIQAIKQRDYSQYTTIMIDLRKDNSKPIEINIPGQHVGFFGQVFVDESFNNYGASYPYVFARVWIERYEPNLEGMHMRHGMGFSGPFTKLFITTPQIFDPIDNIQLVVVIYKSLDLPYQIRDKAL
jgi:hypothetical protein